ncbi:SMI1/KNR4 family protein [Paenibacillus sp. MMS18-CY102]|uniref:SMI1/KNR4 family protein n=1 Tax=Paenibacillus sp. MMS18-CY102 TaxID=2682849 RepID=UPI001365C57D|nr:SMI1/KNR4 family protein [Paenibacillus sp. MMS18-CY102]MWC31273.1 hypothetical protein [Paenibacillus sp. MMS18-CY102]
MKPGTKYPDFEKADLIIKIDGKPVILELPKEVPIAALFSGDFICLDFRVTEEPTVVIWFQEESERFSPVIQAVAQNISEFILMLK